MQRLNGWSGDEVSALELTLDGRRRSRQEMRMKASEAAMVMDLAATSSTDRYPQLFDWLDLIDYNVYAILALMTMVAGFNMISGLLILLFRNISTIGTLEIARHDRQVHSGSLPEGFGKAHGNRNACGQRRRVAVLPRTGKHEAHKAESGELFRVLSCPWMSTCR